MFTTRLKSAMIQCPVSLLRGQALLKRKWYRCHDTEAALLEIYRQHQLGSSLASPSYWLEKCLRESFV